VQWRLDDASAFNYMLVKKGLCLDSDYPYTSGGGQTGTCQSTVSQWIAPFNCTKLVSSRHLHAFPLREFFDRAARFSM